MAMLKGSPPVDPNMANADGLTALHQACIENSLKCATLLLQNGANANAKDNDWWTPLHAAAACGHWRVLNVLLASGADVRLINADGDLAVDLAEGKKTTDILKREMENLGLTDDGEEELRNAAERELKAQIDEMIEQGGDLNACDSRGITLLHAAASNGFTDLVKILINAKVDLNQKEDYDEDTPLHLAVHHLQYGVVEELGNAGATIEVKNRHLETPLLLAEQLEDATMVRLLKALSQKKKATGAARNKPGRRESQASVKRKSFAEKQTTAKKDKSRERSEFADYAKMQANGGVAEEDESATKGAVVYDSTAGAGGDGAAAAPSVEYAVPQKKGSKGNPAEKKNAVKSRRPTSYTSDGSLQSFDGLDDEGAGGGGEADGGKKGGGGCCVVS